MRHLAFPLVLVLAVFTLIPPASSHNLLVSPQQEPSRAPFSIEIPELGVGPVSKVELTIPTPDIRTIKLTVGQPYADKIGYGEIYTRINGESANVIHSIRRSREGKVVTCELESQPRFHLTPGKNVIEISAVDSDKHPYYASFVLIAGGADKGRPSQSGPESRPAMSKFSGRKFAVVLGVSQYKFQDAGLNNLKYADSDARAVRDFLLSREGGGFAQSDILYMENEAATIDLVRAALMGFLSKAGPNDLVLIYIASHGSPDPFDPGKLYFILHDTKVADMRGTALGMPELQELLDHVVRAKRVVVFIDACHSAGISGTKLVTGRQLVRQENNIINLYAAKLYTEVGRAVLTSSDVNEISEEGPNWGGGHGVFTWALLEGLRGAADANRDHVVTAGELFDHVSNRVRQETSARQNPRALSGTSKEFPLAVVAR
jgi:uncharacterized caspase-like protein